jgi:uncharacterized membrane protein required for colicin V production
MSLVVTQPFWSTRNRAEKVIQGVDAYHGFGPVQEVTHRTIERDWLADATALIVVFVVPLIVLKAVGAVIAERVQGGWLGRVDRWLGILFGAVRGAALVCIAYLGLGLVIEPEHQPAWIREAVLLPYVEEGAAVLRSFLPEGVEATVRSGRVIAILGFADSTSTTAGSTTT